MKTLYQALVVVLILLLASPVFAVRHRRPFNGTYRITAGYDNNGSAGGCVDYGCGSRCYNTHTGTDYGLPVGTAIRASASGTVVARNDGCANYGYRGNTCGGRCGNYVKLRHDDGTHTIYCHMKLGGLAVSNGQRVSCGQVLGQSASSGSSTGPHLHHGWQPSSSREPYVGSCGRRGSAVWVQQNGYSSLPSTQCEQTCACNPGAKETRGCGRCGSQSRTCGSNCQWGGWGNCNGQGPCQAGDKQSESCCDCGTRTRTCNNSCNWGDWGGCGGPDPSPAQACDTDKPGVCARGTQRCIQGCLACVENTPASDERCDGLDNDCDGEVDDGAPRELGDTPPDFAAKVLEYSLPGALVPGEHVSAWLRVENVGQRAWSPGQVIIRAIADDPNTVAALGTASWLAYDIPARLEREVASGEVATFQFEIAGAPDAFEGDKARFVVSVLGEGPMMCPEPDAGIEIATIRLIPTSSQAPAEDASDSGVDEEMPDSQGESSQEGGDDPVQDDSSREGEDGTSMGEEGCASAGASRVASTGSGGALAMFVLALLLGSRGRRRRRH